MLKYARTSSASAFTSLYSWLWIRDEQQCEGYDENEYWSQMTIKKENWMKGILQWITDAPI